jgi:hypothetical protein
MAHRAGRIDGLHAAAVDTPDAGMPLLDEADRLEAQQAVDAELLAQLLTDAPQLRRTRGRDDPSEGDR